MLQNISISLKTGLKMIIPGSIRRKITGLFYGWHGSYLSWNDAREKCPGYATDEIFNKVLNASLLVRDGKKPYERDSVTYDQISYSITILSGLLLASSRKNGTLNVLDFGGALGSTYFQNIRFIKHLKGVNWCIVEQETLVDEGIRQFSTDELHFYKSIEDCVRDYSPDVMIFSSVLQYLENPYSLLGKAVNMKPDVIIIDRTPFIKEADRITIQKVHPSIYRAKYPCWFFNEEKFLNFIRKTYHLVEEFEALDKANIKSRFKGFIFITKG